MPSTDAAPVVFRQPRRYHPGYSVLGRWLRRGGADPRRADALFIVLLVLLAFLTLLVHYVAWVVLGDAVQTDPAGPEALTFWLLQLGTGAAYAGLVLAGWQPGATVTCAADGLHLRQGRRQRHLPYEAITSAEPLGALHFHRYYRRYAATEVFATRPRENLLLLRTARGPVVVGLRAADLDRLMHLLEIRGNAPAVDLAPAGEAVNR